MVGSDISAEVTYANYSASCYAGGIAGYLDYGTISNCYNIGSVSSSQRNSSQSPESCAGGIVGCNSGTITNCYNAALLTAVAIIVTLHKLMQGAFRGTTDTV
jgi:hypothetical protein